MNSIKEYISFGLLGTFLLFTSFFLNERYFDFHVYDTFFVSNLGHIISWMACYLLLLFFLYHFVFIKYGKNKFILAHIILTDVSFILLITSFYIASSAYKGNFSNWGLYESNNKFLTAILSLSILIQIFFICFLCINGVIQFIKKQKF